MTRSEEDHEESVLLHADTISQAQCLQTRSLTPAALNIKLITKRELQRNVALPWIGWLGLLLQVYTEFPSSNIQTLQILHSERLSEGILFV